LAGDRYRTYARRLRVHAAATLILLACGSALAAQAGSAAKLSGRPVQMIVPFAAGGPSDVIARFVGELLAKELQMNVVVVNRPGAGTAIGMQALAAAPPDGHTIGIATSSLISNKYTGTGAVEYTRFAPLALVLNSPGAIAVRSDGSWRSLRELVKTARAKDGAVTIGNTGAGGIWELMGFIMKDAHHVPFTSVPYNGGAPMSVALLGGQIDAGIQSVSGWASTVHSGKARLLAIASNQRDRSFSDVATFREEGVDLVYGFWTGFVGPRGLPPALARQLTDALLRIAQSPPFLEFANRIATNVETKGGAEFEQFLKAEDERMAAIAVKYKAAK
jgi:tripartite-type tricarboxylate transporter receptor subunit TctC